MQWNIKNGFRYHLFIYCVFSETAERKKKLHEPNFYPTKMKSIGSQTSQIAHNTQGKKTKEVILNRLKALRTQTNQNKGKHQILFM